jgi:hypothetical protein
MSLPEPQNGLVISYSYLWRCEREAGQVEGVKNRPCAIVLAVRRNQESGPVVTVAPITHSPPGDLTAAIEIPAKVKRHLGLDGERSWIILDDFNEFIWPGFDLRPVPNMPGHYDYGLLPPSLYKTIVTRILELRREGKVFVSSRDE